MSSVNKVILIGRLGADPEVRDLNTGNKVCNFTMATSESWKDKATGEKKEKTEWHRVVVWDQNLISIVERFVNKGDKIYIEGELQTRKWTDEASGTDKYTTEVIMRPFRSSLTMLGSRNQDSPATETYNEGGVRQSAHNVAKSDGYAPVDDLENEIPFS